MHVHVITSGKSNQYSKLLLRDSVRVDGKVRKITYANLSGWTDEKLAELNAALQARRQNRSDPETANRIVNILAEQGVFELRVFRKGKSSEKWKYFAVEPSSEWQFLCALHREDRRKLKRTRAKQTASNADLSVRQARHQAILLAGLI